MKARTSPTFRYGRRSRCTTVYKLLLHRRFYKPRGYFIRTAPRLAAAPEARYETGAAGVPRPRPDLIPEELRQLAERIRQPRIVRGRGGMHHHPQLGNFGRGGPSGVDEKVHFFPLADAVENIWAFSNIVPRARYCKSAAAERDPISGPRGFRPRGPAGAAADKKNDRFHQFGGGFKQ